MDEFCAEFKSNAKSRYFFTCFRYLNTQLFYKIFNLTCIIIFIISSFVLIILSFVESDPILKNFLWKPLATDKQHYAVIESAVEFREYDEDMLLRSNFWKKILDDDIRYPTSFSDKPPVLNEKLYLNR